MIYRFGDLVLDEELRELRRGGQPVSIEPKAFALLSYLATNRARVVPRDELLSGLWPNERVTASSLTFCVNGARTAVGDDGVRQAVIRNLRGQGYRFVAECREEQTPGSELAQAPAGLPPAPVTTGFVGRARELEVFRGALDDAVHGNGRVVLLGGEAGIGKTRTAEELALLARSAGARVLVGRCYEGSDSPAYYPWLQMIRAELSAWRPAQLRHLLGAGASEIARIVPAVRNFLPDVPEAPPADPTQLRFRLFDSIGGFLKSAASWQPLLIVLDDLHWADGSSLALLRFVVTELRHERVLLVGTYRDAEVDAQHPLASVAATLKREGAIAVRLDGLSAPEVHALLSQVSGGSISGELSDRLARETEGNPLFVIELARHLGGAEDASTSPTVAQALPETIQTVIERRLSGLTSETRETLELAAVCGRDFSVHLMERLPRRGGASPLDRLAEAKRQRVIEEVPGIADRYRFVHALFREALYVGIPPLRRARLHAAIAKALMEMDDTAAVTYASEVAQHALAALPETDAASAIDAAARAVEHSLGVLAYEEAVRTAERGLEALNRFSPADDRRRCRMLLLLGEARSRLGETAASRAAFDLAGETARRAGLKRELALAALRGSGGMVQPVILMQDQVAQLDEALRTLGKTDPVLRSRLLSRLALALYYHRDGHRSRRLGLSGEAVRLARARRDDEALYWAWVSRHWALWGPKAAAARLSLADRLVRLAERRGQSALALRAHTYRVGALLELGRFDAVDAAVDTCDRLASELRIPMFLWTVSYFRAMQALVRGDLATAQQLSGAAAAKGSGEAGEDSAAHVFGIQVCAQAFLERKLGSLEPLLLAYRQQRPDMPFLECTLAAIYCGSGREAEARVLLDRLAPRRFAGVPHDNLWPTGMALLGMVAAHLGERKAGRTLYSILRPYDGLQVTCGNAVAAIGPYSHYLGLLAEALGERADARRHARAAQRAAERCGQAPWLPIRGLAG